jgi:hypothetical protein
MIVINEVVRRDQHNLFVRSQKRTKLIFNTRLGMHSPK